MKHLVTVRIESPAFDTDAVRIVELTGTEAISRLFELTLHLAAIDPGALDEQKLLTTPVELVFERTDEKTTVVTEERRIGGIISSVRDRSFTESVHREVIATFVPRAWLSTLTRTTDIFMDMTIPEIVEKKLQSSASLAPPDVEMRLKETYPKREFVVQYKESDHDFICRLTEDLGIHFFWERKGDQDVLVFADENAAFKPATPDATSFRKRGEDIGVFRLESTRIRTSKNFQARDYNYRNPSMDLLGQAQAPLLGAGGLVDEFGPHAKDPNEVTRYAQLRAEEAIARHLTYEAESDLPGLRAGSVLKIEGHPSGELSVVVVEVRHHAKQSVFGAMKDEAGYHNTFKAIVDTTTYRPPRLTPKPIVHGVVTGIVQSGSPTDFGAVDEEGRYRVGFLYDTVTSREEGKASRPLRMTQPSAGAGRGFHQPLKPGTEVMIICLNGDPDRPMIVGAVPNPQTPSPVTSSNAEKSTWKTNVNIIEIDDNAPRINLTVNNSTHVIQIGDPQAPELGVYVASEENLTEKAKKVKTTITEMKNSFSFKKTDAASADILQAAGIPNPLSTWDNIQRAVKATADFANACGEFLDKAEEEYLGATTDAGKNKKEAEEKLAAKQKEIAKALEKQAKEAPKVLVSADGKARYETPEEAKARKYAGQLQDPKNQHYKQELADAAHEAAQANKEFEEIQADVGEELKEYVADGVEAINTVAKKTQTALAKVKEAREKVKQIDAIIKKIPYADKLISKISKIFSKATQQAVDATVTATQKVSSAIPKASGQRKGDSVGSFSKPYNIQMSRHSASLYGVKNTFVYGGMNATMSSARTTSILSRARVDVKSSKEVEIASKEVFVSAKKEIDMYSDGTILMVAKSQGVKVDKASSVVIHGQKDVYLVSDDESMHLKANKNISIFAQRGNLVETVKEGDILMQAQKGKYELEVKTGKMSMRAYDAEALVLSKKDMIVKSSDGNLNLIAEKGQATLKAKTDLKLDCKEGTWKASADVNVKAKNVKLKGSKIHLG